jgi:cyclic di-GMP phosphodiesterase
MTMNADKTKLKKISVDELKVGMFIVNLGRSWISHPFFRNQLKIDSPKKIGKLKKYGIQEVYIDPQQGLDVPPTKVEGEGTIPSGGEGSNPGPKLPNKIGEEMKASTSEAPSPPSQPVETYSKKVTELVPTLEAAPSHPYGGGEVGETEADVPFERLEKSDSVAFWEENIGQLGESLLSQQSPLRIPFDDETPFIREIHAARKVKAEAQTVVRNVINEVRMGKSVESDRVKRAVNSMVDSVLRNHEALTSLSRMKSYDEYIFVHSLDVCILSLSMARHLNLPREEMVEIGIGALLHDVGKVRIDPHILNKPDTLSEKEWVEVRKHPVYGLEIMEESKGIPEQSKQLVLQHHERYSGNGYPFGLKGEAISLGGQIAGIIDFYDAVTTDRPFQKAVQPHEAIRRLYEMGPGEFNRLMVERFIQCIGIYPYGTFVLLDTEEMGIVCGVKPEMLLRPNVLVIYQNSRTPYPQPFLADLNEKADQSSWYKRSIIMPLEPEKWKLPVDDYLGEFKRTLRERGPSV